MKNKITSIAIIANIPCNLPNTTHAIIAHDGKILQVIAACDHVVNASDIGTVPNLNTNAFRKLTDFTVGFETPSNEICEAIKKHYSTKSFSLVMVKNSNINISFNNIVKCIDDAKTFERTIDHEIKIMRDEYNLKYLRESLMKSRTYFEQTIQDCNNEKYDKLVRDIIRMIDNALNDNSNNLNELIPVIDDITKYVKNSYITDDILNSDFIIALEPIFLCHNYFYNHPFDKIIIRGEKPQQEPNQSIILGQSSFLISEAFDEWSNNPNTPDYISRLIKIAKDLMMTSIQIGAINGRFSVLLSTYKSEYNLALNRCDESHKEDLEYIKKIVDSISTNVNLLSNSRKTHQENPVQKADNPYGIFSSIVKETDPAEIKQAAMIANNIMKAGKEFTKHMGVYNNSTRELRTMCDSLLTKYGESHENKIKQLINIINYDVGFECRLFDATIGSLNK